MEMINELQALKLRAHEDCDDVTKIWWHLMTMYDLIIIDHRQKFKMANMEIFGFH